VAGAVIEPDAIGDFLVSCAANFRGDCLLFLQLFAWVAVPMGHVAQVRALFQQKNEPMEKPVMKHAICGVTVNLPVSHAVLYALLCLGLVFGGLLSAGPVWADESDAADGPWSGNVRLGYIATTGNSETENMNFAFGVAYGLERWTHSLAGSAVGASDGNTNTAEAYTLGWRSAFDMTEHDYLFGRVDWLKDKFSGFDQQLSQTVGYGRRVIDQPRQTLNLEIGAGARQSELRDGEEEKEMIGRLGAIYQFNFNDNAQFNFDLGIQTGAENTFTEAVSTLRTTLMGNLAAVLAYTVRNNTDVPAGSEKTDTMTSISLEYNF